jgi:AP endonuclease 2
MKDKVMMGGKEMSILDVVNPPGMFRDGVRAQQWTAKNLLPMSGKLITEFDRRRNIRDMFSRKPSLLTSQTSSELLSNGNAVDESITANTSTFMSTMDPSEQTQPMLPASALSPATSSPKSNGSSKRNQKEILMPVAKRVKSASQTSNTGEPGRGQKSLKGFFAPKTTSKPTSQSDGLDGAGDTQDSVSTTETGDVPDPIAAINPPENASPAPSPARSQNSNDDNFIDPIVAKESWGKLFVKPAAPKCEHDEPCKTMLTKKSGINCGRSFWMCARPLGPSGNKEKATQWRCGTFIWASDWNGAG